MKARLGSRTSDAVAMRKNVKCDGVARRSTDETKAIGATGGLSYRRLMEVRDHHSLVSEIK